MKQETFEEIKAKQFILDETIKINHGLEGEVLVQDKLVSLDVELSEFANEVKFFKFWSQKPMNREKALIEFVDCLHFFASIANDLNLTTSFDRESFDPNYGSMMTDYLRCKKHVINLFTSGSIQISFSLAFNWSWSMGERVGFSEAEVLEAYETKREINFNRQKVGY